MRSALRARARWRARPRDERARRWLAQVVQALTARALLADGVDAGSVPALVEANPVIAGEVRPLAALQSVR